MIAQESLPALDRRGVFSLVFACIFFSGVFQGADGEWIWLRAFDFTSVAGRFGCIPSAEACVWAMSGASGVSQALSISFQVLPVVIFALGTLSLIERAGAFDAARRLLSPPLRPLLGVPGQSGIAMVCSLQSSDGGAAMTRELYEQGQINDRERLLLAMWQLSSSGTLINLFVSGPLLLPFLVVPFALPILVILFCKFVGANLLRVFIYFWLRQGRSL